MAGKVFGAVTWSLVMAGAIFGEMFGFGRRNIFCGCKVVFMAGALFGDVALIWIVTFRGLLWPFFLDLDGFWTVTFRGSGIVW